MPTINRMVSQTGREAGWKRDKQLLLSSLADYQFYTFEDLDYFDDNETIVASFPNFNTDDIIQGHTIGYWAKDEEEPWGINGGYARLYLNIDGTDIPSTHSMRQSLTFAHQGYNDYIPAVDIATNTTIEYAIADVRTIENQYARGLSVDEFETPTGWTYDVEGENMDDLPAEHDHWNELYPYEWFDANSDTHAAWLANDWYYIIPTVTWIVMKRDLDLTDTDRLLNRKGLDYHDGLDSQTDPLTWQIIYPAWTDVDIVINEARFAKVDKQFRWE